MNRRIRFVAALIALVGFTAYFAESLVASACVPVDDMATSVGAAGSAAEGHGVSHAGGHHAATAGTTDAAERPAGSDPVGTHCPLAMPGGSSCTIAATLPAPAASMNVLDHAYHQSTPIIERAIGLLAVNPFFRPPRH
jgi:hypothetical protein